MNRIDERLSEMLCTRHDIEGSHQDKVIQLAELAILENAMNAAGWTRHTGDWDHFITVNDDPYEDCYDWGLEFYDADHNVVNLVDWRGENAIVACVDYDKVVWVGFDDSTNDRTLNIRVDDITALTWTEEH